MTACLVAGTDSDQPLGASPGVLSPAPLLGEPPDTAGPCAKLSNAAVATVEAPAGLAAAGSLVAQSARRQGFADPAAGAAPGAFAAAASVSEHASLDAAAAVQMLTVTAVQEAAAAMPAVSAAVPVHIIVRSACHASHAVLAHWLLCVHAPPTRREI